MYLCGMNSKNKKIQIASFDDTTVIGINSSLVDYKLAWHINTKLNIDFVKYDDLVVEDVGYSFYAYTAGEKYNVFNLVSLARKDMSWYNFSPRVDFLLIIRNDVSQDRVNAIIQCLRDIEGVGHAFQMDVNSNKNLMHVLEIIELHEVSLLEKSKKSNDIKYVRKMMKENALKAQQERVFQA